MNKLEASKRTVLDDRIALHLALFMDGGLNHLRRGDGRQVNIQSNDHEVLAGIHEDVVELDETGLEPFSNVNVGDGNDSRVFAFCDVLLVSLEESTEDRVILVDDARFVYDEGTEKLVRIHRYWGPFRFDHNAHVVIPDAGREGPGLILFDTVTGPTWKLKKHFCHLFKQRRLLESDDELHGRNPRILLIEARRSGCRGNKIEVCNVRLLGLLLVGIFKISLVSKRNRIKKGKRSTAIVHRGGLDLGLDVVADDVRGKLFEDLVGIFHLRRGDVLMELPTVPLHVEYLLDLGGLRPRGFVARGRA